MYKWNLLFKSASWPSKPGPSPTVPVLPTSPTIPLVNCTNLKPYIQHPFLYLQFPNPVNFEFHLWTQLSPPKFRLFHISLGCYSSSILDSLPFPPFYLFPTITVPFLLGKSNPGISLLSNLVLGFHMWGDLRYPTTIRCVAGSRCIAGPHYDIRGFLQTPYLSSSGAIQHHTANFLLFSNHTLLFCNMTVFTYLWRPSPHL